MIRPRTELLSAGTDAPTIKAAGGVPDFDSLIKGMTATQDEETGLISLESAGAVAEFNPYSLEAEFTRILA